MSAIFIPPRLLFIVLTSVSFSSSFTIDESNISEPILEDKNFIDLSVFGSNAFIEPDIETTGRLVAEYSEGSDQNPEELGAYYEGDILMPFRLGVKNGLVAKSYRWPKNIVPYEIRGNFTDGELITIDWAFGEYHKKTCIRFKPRLREKDYISIRNGNSGCWSAAGRVGGKQEVNLQSPSCITSRGTILHEFMHVLGFMHEHNRHDRDRYIVVRTENIKNDMMHAFKKLLKSNAHGMGFGYDFTSVMHYSQNSFSKNGKPTIEVKNDMGESRSMGQRSGFSERDVAKINAMYKCTSKLLK